MQLLKICNYLLTIVRNSGFTAQEYSTGSDTADGTISEAEGAGPATPVVGLILPDGNGFVLLFFGAATFSFISFVIIKL